jgi:hypothetical protein
MDIKFTGDAKTFDKGSTMEKPQGNNFVENPAGSANAPEGRDFTAESREQEEGGFEDLDKTSAIKGGSLPFPTATPVAEPVPFKNLK